MMSRSSCAQSRDSDQGWSFLGPWFVTRRKRCEGTTALVGFVGGNGPAEHHMFSAFDKNIFMHVCDSRGLRC